MVTNESTVDMVYVKKKDDDGKHTDGLRNKRQRRTAQRVKIPWRRVMDGLMTSLTSMKWLNDNGDDMCVTNATFLPGHGSALHSHNSLSIFSRWLAEPVMRQSSPPCADGGSLHCRVLICWPPPQVAEHSLYSDHCPQLPLTVNLNWKIYCHTFSLEYVSRKRPFLYVSKIYFSS